MIFVNPLFESELRSRGIYSKQLINAVMAHGSLKDVKDIPKDIRRLFVTSHNIKPEWHVRIQAAFQKHVDNAISKTVNLAQKATRKDVERVFLLAYKLGCKGVTVYRDMSRKDQIMKIGRCKGCK
jgi:ribonucleoside-diphosphate reductase alpha chain